MKLLSFILISCIMFFNACSEDNNNNPVYSTNPGDQEYDITIDPSDFIDSNFTGNDFFPLSPGTTYVYEGEAEDVAQVLSLSQTVSVPYGTYTNCLQTAEWTPLEPGIVEHKYYAAGIGMLKAEAVEGEFGYETLVEIQFD